MISSFKRSAKRLWRKTGAFKLFAFNANAFVLSFHRVKPLDNSLIDARLGAISPKCLEQTLKMVMDLGFKFVSFEDFTKSGDRADKSVCLTFDDGLRDIADFVFPVLKNLKIPATLFLITSTVHRRDLLWQHRIYAAMELLSIDDCLRCLPSLVIDPAIPIEKPALAGRVISTFDRQELQDVSHLLANAAGLTSYDEHVLSQQLYLKEQEISNLENGGITVAGHGFEHWPAAKLTQAELFADYQACHDDLSGWLDHKRFAFCVPFGDVSNDCVNLAVRAGFADVLASNGFVSSAAGRSCARFWPNENLDNFAWLLSRGHRK